MGKPTFLFIPATVIAEPEAIKRAIRAWLLYHIVDLEGGTAADLDWGIPLTISGEQAEPGINLHEYSATDVFITLCSEEDTPDALHEKACELFGDNAREYNYYIALRQRLNGSFEFYPEIILSIVPPPSRNAAHLDMIHGAFRAKWKESPIA